ncbi:MAG: penicillin acylase family protein [Chitinophagales bacterium]|nr:penicillin acylase family protein [Chitinophagales bacterium]MDW8392855.1 penicillin acylase family protein [Chitinophagales bacterium]
MRWLGAAFSGVLCLVLLLALSSYHQSFPALGLLFSPYRGFWQNFPLNEKAEKTVPVEGLRASVTILLDSNRIPHVRAQTMHDLYFAQGYLHASNRLWQMEFLARAASGRLSEWIGKATVDFDRQMRRFGMGFAAEHSLHAIEQDSLSRMVLDAYTAGVNAYILQLQPADVPIEYKLLSAVPEAWSNLKSVYIAKLMTYDLSTLNDDYALTAVFKKMGKTVADSLFGSDTYFREPIIPRGITWPFSATVPPVPDVICDTAQIVTDSFVVAERGIGSNNWAVSGRLTASSKPILCGDPHLRLSMPSLWYAMHLIGPDGWVAGASLVGTPGIIIGFNEQLAWSLTNVAADVMDWYRISFRDASCREYRYEQEYRPVHRRVETVNIRGDKAVLDTVLYTHHGPVVAFGEYKPLRSDIPPGCALRWIGHDGDNAVRAFLEINRARSYPEFAAALIFFESPAQNFVYADRQGNIALWVNGKFPLKWPEQGKYILDGSRSDHEWQGWIPREQVPQVRNPSRGFVSSANQWPADSSYPYFLNWIFEVGSRGYRINERLATLQLATVDSMRLLQTDHLNVIARAALPVLLPLLQQKPIKHQQAVQVLQSWNLHADSLSVGHTLFQTWWQELVRLIWNDDFARLATPKTEATLLLLTNGKNRQWIDRKDTPERETLTDIAVAAFEAAVDSLTAAFGVDPMNWRWGKVKQTTLQHSLQIEAFSRRLSVNGDKMIVLAAGRTMGPSWRMVVELGDPVSAWWIYPGGQSGNPGSAQYDAFVEDWRTGRLRRFLLLDPELHRPQAVSFITLKKP